ncbi:MAG: glycine--tRNA ligase, partial [Verrucomicrobiota bacterium]|nr:glycine--tRNA ligase [Verrucomicrobiota bacterium]
MAKDSSLIEEIVSLAKRRGFVFQSSEIYGGLNGFFDYGPLGVELRKNIKDAWWEDMVRRRDDVVGLDSSIVMNPKVWEASGHVDGFTDPMVDCKESKMRYRADQLFACEVKVEGESMGWISLLESESMHEDATRMAENLKRKAAKQGELSPIHLKPYDELSDSEQVLVPSPATGKVGSLTPPREFNMMFETHVGALRDASSKCFLRPETAQGIFANFKNITDTGRVKVPFGIAQIGKAFRNEITPRNFIFR